MAVGSHRAVGDRAGGSERSIGPRQPGTRLHGVPALARRCRVVAVERHIHRRGHLVARGICGRGGHCHGSLLRALRARSHGKRLHRSRHLRRHLHDADVVDVQSPVVRRRVAVESQVIYAVGIDREEHTLVAVACRVVVAGPVGQHTGHRIGVVGRAEAEAEILRVARLAAFGREKEGVGHPFAEAETRRNEPVVPLALHLCAVGIAHGLLLGVIHPRGVAVEVKQAPQLEIGLRIEAHGERYGEARAEHHFRGGHSRALPPGVDRRHRIGQRRHSGGRLVGPGCGGDACEGGVVGQACHGVGQPRRVEPLPVDAGGGRFPRECGASVNISQGQRRHSRRSILPAPCRGRSHIAAIGSRSCEHLHQRLPFRERKGFGHGGGAGLQTVNLRHHGPVDAEHRAQRPGQRPAVVGRRRHHTLQGGRQGARSGVVHLQA